MISPPLVLVTPCVERKGFEMGDVSSSLAETYQQAIMAAGGLPLTLPCTTAPKLIAECVRRADGIMLTGGDDIHPDLHSPGLPKELLAKATPECRERCCATRSSVFPRRYGSSICAARSIPGRSASVPSSRRLQAAGDERPFVHPVQKKIPP